MSQPDLILRKGTVVDGTGRPPFIADVAVAGGKIIAMGADLDLRGKEEQDVSGLIVAPGWIDPHTHFDAQYSWDPYLTPSTPAGVTTVVMGNCGIGFAPCQADRRQFLAEMMEAIEDIPERVIAEGLDYDFETWEEYMDSIERKKFACDIAVMVGHCAVRTWVMGKRASLADRPGGPSENPLKPHEIEAIAALVKDAVAAGAFGFSTSRLLIHRDPRGILTPGALAGTDELKAICHGIAEGGGGVFELSTDWLSYDDVPYDKIKYKNKMEYQRKEAAWMLEIAATHGHKVAFTYNVADDIANEGKQIGLRTVEAICQAGSRAYGQVFARPQGFLYAFGGRIHPFVVSRTYRKINDEFGVTAQPEMLQRLQNSEVRQNVLKETLSVIRKRKSLNVGMQQLLMNWMPWSEVFLWTPDGEPTSKDSVEAMAVHEGKHPLEFVYDVMAHGGVFWKPQFGLYSRGDLGRFYDLLVHPNVIPGFDDAGAHGTVFQDSVIATYGVAHYVRDRTRGPRIPIEHMVQKLTGDVAHLYGFKDRGILTPGMRADLNVFDLDSLAIKKPRLVADLPLGQTRWYQDVDGYVLTLVAGCPTYRHGKPTGSLPGTLVRNPQRKPSAWQGVAPLVSGPFESGLAEPDRSESDSDVLDGLGTKGGSALARLLRTTVEADKGEPRSRL